MNKLTAELLHQLKSAAQEEIMCREASDTSDAWQDLASPENILTLIEIALPVLEQQAETAKPIECPFPCGWKELLRISMSDGAFLARDLLEGGEVKDFHRHAALSNTDRLVKVITEILNAQEVKSPPQTTTDTYQQIENDDWIEWKGGARPVRVENIVDVRFRDGSVSKNNFAGELLWSRSPLGDQDPYDIIAYRVIENDGREG
ncbi:hypothetical protein [Pantoea sp.]|uniref:hypothetical protein n=1 Tax=Pantoea sp. TaxID=69393 RepID=UPI0031D5F76E